MLSNLLTKLQSGNLPYITYKKGNSLVCHEKILKNHRNFTQVKSVCFGNIMIKRGSIILVRINDDNFPLFGEIVDIFKTKTNVSLLTPCFSATIKYVCNIL